MLALMPNVLERLGWGGEDCYLDDMGRESCLVDRLLR